MLNVMSGSGPMERDVKDDKVIPRYSEGSISSLLSPGLLQSTTPGVLEAIVVRTTIGCGIRRIMCRNFWEWASAGERVCVEPIDRYSLELNVT